MEKGCYGCRHFKAYYMRGYANFSKTDLGFCNCRKKTLDKHEICENYSAEYYGVLDGKVVIRHLYEALKSLNAIAIIWEEEQNKGKK